MRALVAPRPSESATVKLLENFCDFAYKLTTYTSYNMILPVGVTSSKVSWNKTKLMNEAALYSNKFRMQGIHHS